MGALTSLSSPSCKRFTMAALLCALIPALAWSQPAPVELSDLVDLTRSLDPNGPSGDVVSGQTEEGYVRFLNAPDGGGFLTSGTGNKSAAVGSVAQGFVQRHAGALGMKSNRLGYKVDRISGQGAQANIHLGQTYGGLEVFGTRIMVQLDETNRVTALLSDIMRDPTDLDSGHVSLTPLLTSSAAKLAARVRVGLGKEKNTTTLVASAPKLVIYDPAVLDLDGGVRLAWQMVVSDPTDRLVKEQVFVDASTGDVVLQYSLIKDALDRNIFDANGTFTFPFTPIRTEGEPATGTNDVDAAYDFLGDTYNFYMDQHDRDSIDGNGMSLDAVVRFGRDFANAFWDGERMVFGQGFVVDDVTGHELTHGVTEFSSNLIYRGESGAINESFSDLWGEYVDLVNGAGDDSAEVRWLMGEEIPIIGAIRNMADPPEFDSPDRYKGDFWIPTSSAFDNGGVHFNSGVNNKMCYLLTDGDNFNDQTVVGMGMDRIAALYYEAQINLLGPSSNYKDLAAALLVAGGNLGWSEAELCNLRTAILAVGVPGVTFKPLRHLRALSSEDLNSIVISWTNPTCATASFNQKLVLLRRADAFPEGVNDPLATRVPVGQTNSVIDNGVTGGQEYFYALFETNEATSTKLVSRTVAGRTAPDFLAQSFSDGDIDLSYSQILFTPIIDATAREASGRPDDYLNFSNYTATIRHDVFSFPVPERDAQGGPFQLPMVGEFVSWIELGTEIPFFGGNYDFLYLRADGFVEFSNTFSLDAIFNFDGAPDMTSHWSTPRISFLSARLAPEAGGHIWGRGLDDRLVITLENVPEFDLKGDAPNALPPLNSLQMELFNSGHIRITYGQVGARTAVVGLSDGNAVPLDPLSVIAGDPKPLPPLDLSALPENDPDVLNIWPPLPNFGVAEGDTVSFVVTAAGSTELTPRFSVTWDRADAVPFTDLGDGTGQFFWETVPGDMGFITLMVSATAGSEAASQNIIIYVADGFAPPTASDVWVGSTDFDPQAEGSDPFAPRNADTDASLTLNYVYDHPLASTTPSLHGEGSTRIFWYRNGGLVDAFINQSVIPATATRSDDRWNAMVSPVTLSGIEGKSVVTPSIHIVGMPPRIDRITPNQGTRLGGTTVLIEGARLSAPMRVTFGGIEALSVHSLGPNALEAVTRPHPISPIEGGVIVPEAVTVQTPIGSTTAALAFAFVDDGAILVKADLNQDGSVDVIDIRLMVIALMENQKAADVDGDVNEDGVVNSADLQVVVNEALGRY